MAITKRIRDAAQDLETALCRAELLSDAFTEATGNPDFHDDHRHKPPAWTYALRFIVEDLNAAAQHVVEAINAEG